jgi:hypothetical protein
VAVFIALAFNMEGINDLLETDIDSATDSVSARLFAKTDE